MTQLVWCGNSGQMISNGLRRRCLCQVTVTDSSPEFPERKPLEVSRSSLSEALSKEESTEMPVEKTKVELSSDEAEEKTEVEPSDNHEEEKTASTNQIEVKEGDQDEDKVMRQSETHKTIYLDDLSENIEFITNETNQVFHCDAKTIK